MKTKAPARTVPASVHRRPAPHLAVASTPQHIAAAGLLQARARAQHRSRERAAERISNASMREPYDGAELRPFEGRPGAMDAYRLPSLFNGRRVERARAPSPHRSEP